MAAKGSVTRFLSARAKRTPANAFAPLVPLMKDPSCVNLAGGVPPPSCYPIQGIDVRLKDGSTVSIDEADAELAQRYPPFAWGKVRRWVRSTTERLWRPPGDEWDVSVTAGSMSGIDVVFSMLLEDGDVLLVEEYSFTAALDWLKAAGVAAVPVRLDCQGLVPEALAEACCQATRRGRPAKAIYVIPTGQNPTGAQMTASRVRDLYRIAAEHDLLIIEDDPYFFLQHSTSPEPGPEGAPRAPAGEPAMGSAGTFISVDTDGRVIRLDSFSKVVAAGFRLGWVTAHRDLVRAYDGLAYFSSQHGSSLSLMVLGRMLESWGWGGFLTQVTTLQRKLRRNTSVVVAAAEQYLTGVVEWNVPVCGMFLWVRLSDRIAPDALVELMASRGVAVVHGDFCAARPHEEAVAPGGDAPHNPCFVRLSLVLDDEARLEEGVRRLAELLQSLPAPARGH